MKSKEKNEVADEKWIDFSDISVFQQQYMQHFRELKYFGLQYIEDEEVVADLIQDIWLKIWENKERPINETAFKQYLFHALYRSILNYIKHINVVRNYAESHSEEAVEEEITYRLIEAEVYQAINQVFEELPDACRRVYTASLEGKSQKEIAEEFYISINTVKKHINNANHYMKKHLKEFLLIFLLF